MPRVPRSSAGNGVKERTDTESYKAPIRFDERLEGGIPDSLLEGLGFSEDVEQASRTSPTHNDESDDDVMEVQDARGGGHNLQHQMLAQAGQMAALPDSVTSILMNQLSTLAANQGGLANGLTPKQYLDMVKSGKGFTPQSIQKAVNPTMNRNRSSGHQSTAGSANRSTPHNATSSSSHAALTDAAAAMIAVAAQDAARRAIGATRPPGQVQPRSNQPNAGRVQPLSGQSNAGRVPPGMSQPSSGRVQPSQVQPGRGRPGQFAIEPRTITKGSIVYEKMPTGEVVASLVKKQDGNRSQQQWQAQRPNQYTSPQQRPPPNNNPQIKQMPVDAGDPPENCPVNEYNVGDVLERAMGATQSMRVLLASMRDDLRRVGANVVGSGTGTVLQAQKRQEIAEKLSKAYSAYKKSIEDMCPVDVNIAGSTKPPQMSSTRPPQVVSRPPQVVSRPIQPQPTQNVPRMSAKPVGGAGFIAAPAANMRGEGVSLAAQMSRQIKGESQSGGAGSRPRLPSPALYLLGGGRTAASPRSVPLGVADMISNPGSATSSGGRKRPRSQNRGEVIELSDSGASDDEEAALLASLTAAKDPVAEKRSRDQRAADRASLRNASLAAEAAKSATRKARRSNDASQGRQYTEENMEGSVEKVTPKTEVEEQKVEEKKRLDFEEGDHSNGKTDDGKGNELQESSKNKFGNGSIKSEDSRGSEASEKPVVENTVKLES